MQGQIVLISMTGDLIWLFFLKGCFFCNENLDSVPRDTVSVTTDFLCSLSLLGFFLVYWIFVFTSPECKHFIFLSAFLGKGSFYHLFLLWALEVPCKWVIVVVHFTWVTMRLCSWICENRRLLWNKLVWTEKRWILVWSQAGKFQCLSLFCFSPPPLQEFFTKHFSCSPLHLDSYREGFVSTLQFLFREPASMPQILPNFFSDLNTSCARCLSCSLVP